MANSRRGLEAGLAGLKAAECIATMFGLHDTKKSVVVLCGGFFCRKRHPLKRLLLKRRNIAISRIARGRRTRPGVFPMGDVQPLVQAAFNAPGGPRGRQPWGGGQFRRRQAAPQDHHFRGVLAQVSSQESHLLHTGKSHRLRAGGPRAQQAQFGLALVDLTLARQRGRRLPRGKNAPEAPPPVVGCSLAAWVGCP